MNTNVLFQEHSAPHSQLTHSHLEAAPVQPQSDLFATEQLLWSSQRLSALLVGTSASPLCI